MSAPVSYYDMTLALIKGKISDSALTRAAIAAGVGISVSTLRRKLAGESTLTVREIGSIAGVLGCKMSEIVA